MGKIETDHTGSGGGITLSSDGTSLLLDGTAVGGGGGADLFAENYDGTSTLPSATGTNAVAIGLGAVSSGLRSVAIGNLANASSLRGFAVGVNSAASGSNAISMGANSASSGSASVAIGTESSAASDNSFALGYQAKTATGSQATAVGYRAYASGTDSFAAAIANNTGGYGATATSSVSLGKLAKATGGYATAIGESTQAQGNNSVCLGYYSQSQGQGTMVMGYDAQSTAVHCTAIGTNTRNAIDGTFKFSGGKHSAAGDAQVGIYPVLCETTDATATTFVTYHSNTITPQTDNQIVLPNNSAYAFSGTIVARQKASEGTACAAWKIEGLIRREGSAGTTVLVNSAKTILDNTPNWDVTLSADTTNGCLKIQGTGAASTNIRWSSTITTSELTYA